MEHITPERMKELETIASSHGLDSTRLMENAGRAVAELVERRYGGRSGRSALVLCGAGNNGGDGLVVARHLCGLGWRVRVVLLASPDGIKTSEARRNWELLPQAVGAETAGGPAELARSKTWDATYDVVVDAMLGTGARGEAREPVRTAISLVNRLASVKVAVDIPSGLDSGSGEVGGEVVEADLTVALHAPKVGSRGREKYTGEVVAVDIGIEEGWR